MSFPAFSPLSLIALITLTGGIRDPSPALRAVCQTQAADPKNPWALAHGLTALGPSFQARDGRNAVEVILHDFVQPGGATSFAAYAPDGTPIDPHPNLLTKTLLLAGVPRGKVFETPKGKVTLEALVRDIERRFQMPSGPWDPAWSEAAWTVDVLSTVHVPGDHFHTDAGVDLSVDALMDAALAALEHAQAPLLEAMAAGKPRVEKHKQGIYAHPCGGLHLVQAVLGWARHEAVRKRWKTRLAQQVDILLYREGSESLQYDEALRTLPNYRLQVRAQQLKFQGHLLETLGRLRAEHSFTPTPRQKAEVEQVQNRLAEAVEGLERLGAFRELMQEGTRPSQRVLDLVGDACHAFHGVTYWRK